MTQDLADRIAALPSPPSDAAIDAVISGLYRRFKDWSKRGFGPDDVTWCEVRADVLKLISALPAPVPLESREAFEAHWPLQQTFEYETDKDDAWAFWQSAWAAALSWQAAAPAQSREGWVLVPREPTEAMDEAIVDALGSCITIIQDGVEFGPETAGVVMRALLSAAPAAPTAQPEGLTEEECRDIAIVRADLGAFSERANDHISDLLAIIDRRLQRQRG